MKTSFLLASILASMALIACNKKEVIPENTSTKVQSPTDELVELENQLADAMVEKSDSDCREAVDHLRTFSALFRSKYYNLPSTESQIELASRVKARYQEFLKKPCTFRVSEIPLTKGTPNVKERKEPKDRQGR